MATSFFGLGGMIAAGVTKPKREEFVATAGQTLFTLTTFSYTPGVQAIEVEINGQLQKLTTDYTETSTTTFTLTEGALAGDYVTIRGYL